MSQAVSVLVTGARGFIGQHLVADFRRNGISVREWDSDIQEISILRESFHVVVHLAGITDQEMFQSDPAESYLVNVVGTLAVLEYCRHTGASCVLSSTCGVYKNADKVSPLSESSAIAPSGPYATSKLLAEQVAAFYAYKYSLSVTVLRLFNVYGSGQRKNFLIPEVLGWLLGGKKLEFRTPQSVRDFIYINDVIAAFRLASERCTTGFRIYNIGSGVGITVKEVAVMAEKIFEATGIKLQHEGALNQIQEVEPDVCIADISRAVSELKWEPRYTFEEGLRAMKESVLRVSSAVKDV